MASNLELTAPPVVCIQEQRTTKVATEETSWHARQRSLGQHAPALRHQPARSCKGANNGKDATESETLQQLLLEPQPEAAAARKMARKRGGPEPATAREQPAAKRPRRPAEFTAGTATTLPKNGRQAKRKGRLPAALLAQQVTILHPAASHYEFLY